MRAGLPARTVTLLAMLAAVAIGLPNDVVHPATLSLVKVETAKAVDFDEGTVWILALGSDARPPEDLFDARADAIQLIGIDFEAGRAVGIGVPRDSWVAIPGHGSDRINAGLNVGGPELMAQLVEDLVGVAPDYVFTVGFGGFQRMVDSVGALDVFSPRSFRDDEFGLKVRRGMNEMDGPEALSFARARHELTGGDFDRSANQQQLLKGMLRRIIAGEDETGFMESETIAAIARLDTNLSLSELYRLAQAVTQVKLSQVTMCVVTGTYGTENGAAIVYADAAQAHRLSQDALDDMTLRPGCDG